MRFGGNTVKCCRFAAPFVVHIGGCEWLAALRFFIDFLNMFLIIKAARSWSDFS